MNKPLLAWVTVTAMTLPLATQEPLPQARTSTATTTADVHGLPGKRAGTERWIVQFEKRSFDLSAYRAAVYARRPAAEVAKIVADLEKKVLADQAAFVRKVEADLDATVFAQWWLVNACAIEVAPKNLDRLRGMVNVARVEPDREWLPWIKASSNSANHNSDFVHQVLKIDGKGVAVGILDTGQDDTVSTSVGRPHRTYYINGDPNNTSGTGIKGSRLILNKQIGKMPASDTDGHGTAVASVAAGANWGTQGADHGQAYGANIAGYAIPDSPINGGTSTATMVSAWQEVGKDRVGHNIVAANLSYSGSPSLTDTAQQALDSVAYNGDVVCCVACGNGDKDTTNSQGAANGLAVGAIRADTQVVAQWSSKGPLGGSGGRFYPDLAACGEEVVMAQVGNEGTDMLNSGTSMASPQVCGAAALVRAANPKLTAIETKAILLATTRDITKQNPGGSRNTYGLGMLRTDLAVQLAQASSGHGTGTVNTNTKVVTVSMNVTNGRQYTAVVAWHRTNMSSSTYSNLDIRILDGTTEVTKSNTPGNLYESVVFTANKTGSFTLEITGTTLPAGSQNFAYAFATVPVPAVVAAFGKGCTGSGIPLPAVCQSANTGSKLSSSIGSDGWTYAIEVTANANLSITGYEIRSDSRSTFAKPIAAYLCDADTSGLPNNVLATGSMLVAQSEAWYRTIFDKKVAIQNNQKYFLVFDNPKFEKGGSIRMPFAATGNVGTHWRRSGPSRNWIADTSRALMWQTLCAGTGGAPPVASTEGEPVINTPFTLTLRQALASAPGMVIVGVSKTQGFGTSLPWELTIAGAPGCSLLVSGEIILPIKVNASGGFDMPFVVPNDKNAIGLTVYTQFAVQDQQANFLGWAFSNALGLTVGG